MISMEQFFLELSKLTPPTFAAIAAVTGALGAILVAIITVVIGKLIVTPFLGARDKQDREVEWRKHAIELTKLDLERNLRTRAASDKKPRPVILDFLANYRDLRELGTRTPTELYELILKNRINTPASAINSGQWANLAVKPGDPQAAQKESPLVAPKVPRGKQALV
jgi:hypothetical protein